MEFVIKAKRIKRRTVRSGNCVEKKAHSVLSDITVESVGRKYIRIIGPIWTLRFEEATATIKKSWFDVRARRANFSTYCGCPRRRRSFYKTKTEWVVKLSSGKSNFRLAGVNMNNSRKFPASKKRSDEAVGGDFLMFIRAFAITNEQSRFTLSRAQKFMTDGFLTAQMDYDGHRLAFIEKNWRERSRRGLMDALFRKTLMELTKKSRRDTTARSFGEDNIIWSVTDFSHHALGISNYEVVIRR